ncbi:hypothetical protein [Glycocaulis sp.]|uniref:hypothetical protein n=1 Tax=Glycocaulis sp. TaxID=1969725 RepID=UPI003D211C60
MHPSKINYDNGPLPEVLSNISHAPEGWADLYHPAADGTYKLPPVVNEVRREVQYQSDAEIAELKGLMADADKAQENYQRRAKENEIRNRYHDLLADFEMPRGLKDGLVALLRASMQPKAEIIEVNDGITVKVTCRDGQPLNRWTVEAALHDPELKPYLKYWPAWRAQQEERKFTRELETIN